MNECLMRLDLNVTTTMATKMLGGTPVPGQPMGIDLILSNHRGSTWAMFVCKIWTLLPFPHPQEICGLIPRKFVDHPEIPVKRVSMFRLKYRNITTFEREF